MIIGIGWFSVEEQNMGLETCMFQKINHHSIPVVFGWA